MPFRKGAKRPARAGRKKGTPNKLTSGIGLRWRAMLATPRYRAFFTKRLKAGRLPPMLEALMWHYAYGKPIETQVVTGVDGGPVTVNHLHLP